MGLHGILLDVLDARSEMRFIPNESVVMVAKPEMSLTGKYPVGFVGGVRLRGMDDGGQRCRRDGGGPGREGLIPWLARKTHKKRLYGCLSAVRC